MLNRREFLAVCASAAATPALAAAPHFRVGITTNTRGGWKKDVLLSFREAHEVGFHNVETFYNYVRLPS